MFRKISILVIFFVFLGVGFFAIVIDKKMNQPKPKVSHLNEAQSYCMFKGGRLDFLDGIEYCVRNDRQESVQIFFDRLGE